MEIVGEAECERVVLPDGLAECDSDGVFECGIEWESDGENDRDAVIEDDTDIVADGAVVRVNVRVNDDEFDGRDVALI